MKTRHSLVFAWCIWLLVGCGKQAAETSPQRKDLTDMVFASGSLEADDQYNLTNQTAGYLVRLNFVEGDTVRAGQTLAVIDNSQNIINAEGAAQLHRITRSNTRSSAPALLQITANIDAAKAKLSQDQNQADRYQRLLASNSVSTLEYETMRLAATNSRAALRALQEQYSSQQTIARQQDVSQRFASDVSQVLRTQNQIRAIQTGRVYRVQFKSRRTWN